MAMDTQRMHDVADELSENGYEILAEQLRYAAETIEEKNWEERNVRD